MTGTGQDISPVWSLPLGPNATSRGYPSLGWIPRNNYFASPPAARNPSPSLAPDSPLRFAFSRAALQAPREHPLPVAARDLVGRLFRRDRSRVGRYLGSEKRIAGAIQAAGRARLLARRNEERSASARLACPTLQSCQSAYRRLL